MIKPLAGVRVSRLAVLMVVVLFCVSVANYRAASAACTPLPTDKGTVTQTLTIPTGGTYRIWTRILAPDTSNNSVYMQIDDTLCSINIGDNASLPANAWTWVDYVNGNSASTNNVALSAGTHTLTIAGREAGVEVDRVVLTDDLTCVPSGVGDNCASPPDAVPPVVAITSPAANASVTGLTNVAVLATDDVAIAKVELYLDGSLYGTDSVGPYAFSIAAGSLPIGSHLLVAKAYDTANNLTTSQSIAINVPDTIAPTITFTSPSAGAAVAGIVNLAATASDNIGVSRVEFFVDGSLKNSDTIAPYNYNFDTTGLTGSHTLSAKAYDSAGNNQPTSPISVTVNSVTYIPADINQDGHVNVLDFSLLIGKYGQSGTGLGRCDINLDGHVDVLDFSLLIAKYGQ